jgi:hypothetical protein
MEKFSNGELKLFPSQKMNETVFILTRPHWFILVKKILVWALAAIMLLITDRSVTLVFGVWGEFDERIFLILRGVVSMGLLAALFTLWIIYYLNYQVVTNERIVDVDQKGVFYHSTAELHLKNVEDVTVKVKGVFPTLLNYGTVFVQTAGKVNYFEFDHIPEPHKVAKLILQVHDKLANKRLHEKK